LLRSSIREPFLAAASVVLLSLTACTSSSDSDSLDPPHLRIDSIETPGGSAWTPGGSQDCVQFGSDPMHTLSINMGPNDRAGHLLSPNRPPVSWTLSPPLTCAGTPPCGFLALTVDSCVTADAVTCNNDRNKRVAVIVSAGPSIPVAMKDASPGFYRFHVELYNPDSTQAIDRAGKLYAAEQVVNVTTVCGSSPPIPTDGGRDASMRLDSSVGKPPDGAVVRPDGAVVPPPDAARAVEAAAPNVEAGARRDASVDGSVHDASLPRDAATQVDARLPLPADARPKD
jgi:hypothetical protein